MCACVLLCVCVCVCVHACVCVMCLCDVCVTERVGIFQCHVSVCSQVCVLYQCVRSCVAYIYVRVLEVVSHVYYRRPGQVAPPPTSIV